MQNVLQLFEQVGGHDDVDLAGERPTDQLGWRAPTERRAWSSVVQKGPDNGADMAADLRLNRSKPVDEPIAIDGADQFALDVAGFVEAALLACVYLHME